MDRPALQRLLANISDGLIDVVVVYKVDRLTRSLADFAKMVEQFDARGISFLAVTQQFNTTTSMGRLPLNVLLSFAQFERQVTGERIRDKIAASKRKGMWMGGTPPLGYDIRERRLVINPSEANTVGLIYERYLKLGCVRQLGEARNRVEGPGFAERHQVRRVQVLAGSVINADDEPLYVQGETKGRRRYRYYVSKCLVNGSASDNGKGWRLAAPEIERTVTIAARHMLSDRAGLLEALEKSGIDSPDVRATLESSSKLLRQLQIEA